MTGRALGPGRLGISATTVEGTVEITLEGELDLGSAPQLEQRLHEIEQSGTNRVIVDLRQLAFIDSTGLRLLLQAHARCSERRCEFVLRPGGEPVQRVFDLTGALKVLRFEDPSEI